MSKSWLAQNNGTVIASYAAGSADGWQRISGFCRRISRREWRDNYTRLESYAIGSARWRAADGGGGTGNSDSVGGIGVGLNEGGTIAASYADGIGLWRRWKRLTMLADWLAKIAERSPRATRSETPMAAAEPATLSALWWARIAER